MTTRAAGRFDEWGDDELALDRLPGMPMVGFLAGTVLSFGIWALVALVAWGVTG